jgi:signal transduction histidine kinase
MTPRQGAVSNIGAPRVRLTMLYAGLLLLLQAAFSGIVYALLSLVVYQDVEPFRDDPGILAAAHHMLHVYALRLLAANGLALILVVAVAAQLAKTTLRPLERAIALQRQFTSDASHDLRTPLAVIRTETSAALAGTPREPEQYAESLRIIDEQAQRMERLIDQLLTLSHLDADSALEREPTDLSVVVNGVVRQLTPLAEARTVSLEVERCESAIVLGDELKLSQLVGNLVDNAIKHVPERCAVAVAVWRERDSAFVRVRDNGLGIKAADLQTIFERKQQTNGMPASPHGLGLPLCRWIARAHGGDVVAQSAPGHGTIFTVRLPAMSA